MTPSGDEIDYATLVLPDRLHGSVFTSREIFDHEIERIFHGWWVYVGHESEVAQPGDYRLKRIGRQSVIMSRDRDGTVHLLMNRCRHRGSIVCHREQGNASFFRCQYHGWTYRNDGALVGVPFPGAYGQEFDRKRLGLTAVPLQGSYRGFVFGCLNPDVPVTLDEHLEGAKEFINSFIDASPLGEIELRSGVTRSRFHGNWKYVGMDGYHPAFTHKSIQDMMEHTRPDAAGRVFAHYSEKSPQRAVDMGNGHVRLDEQQVTEDTLLSSARKAEAGADRYRELMHEAYGDDAPRKIAGADPHMHVWPNLQLTGAHVRVLRPLAPDLTEVEGYPALLKGAPDEINVARLRGHEWFHGPASFGSPDDTEMFERVQVGLMADPEPWVLLARGLKRESRIEDGHLAGNITDETTQRGQFKQWLRVMQPTPLADDEQTPAADGPKVQDDSERLSGATVGDVD